MSGYRTQVQTGLRPEQILQNKYRSEVSHFMNVNLTWTSTDLLETKVPELGYFNVPNLMKFGGVC